MAMGQGPRSLRSDINVTPLVDVVLVLLIIFMVVTPLLQRGKPVALPEARHVSPLGKGGDPVLLSVTRDGRVWLDGDLHAKQELRDDEIAAEVALEVQHRPDVHVVVKADRDVAYRRVREVTAQLARTRLAGVSLAAARSDEGRGRGESP